MSNIKAAYAAIAAWEPTGVTTTRNITAVQLAVADADLPCRLLLPATSTNGDFVMMGTLQNTAWVVRDLCMWAKVGAGAGVEQYSEAMLDYIASYLTKIKGKISPAANCVIAGWEVQMGVVPWGNSDYYAVDIYLTIQEKI